jgi:hypothetical protein
MVHINRIASPKCRHSFQRAALMRIHSRLAATMLLTTASITHAQTQTADGVDALLRGEYQRAAEILKPIAERSPRPDHVAEFFMGTLYENGQGVEADTIRACALYVRASSESTSPFGVQASALVRRFRGSLSREAFEDCTLLASSGFDHGFQSVTFTLETGHWIAWDLRGYTIGYNGKSKRTETVLLTNGAVFLPLQHTELSVGPLRSTRRHFIEIFTWIPNNDRQAWTLLWRLFEVVRDNLVTITTEQLVTISGQQPPLGRSFDVRQWAGLRVNDGGDPEWAVLDRANPRSAVISSEADRLAERERDRARSDAEARVDWNRVLDVHRTPSLSYADANGCGHVFLFGWSEDRTEFITVRADKDVLQLSTTPQTFDAASQQNGLEVMLHVYERPTHSQFCTDIGMPAVPEETWRATRGTITIELTAPGVRTPSPFMYRATVRIVGAEFVNPSGTRVRQERPITLTAIVGWVAG